MTTPLEELIALLALDQIEDNIFRGASEDLGWGRLYGGQTLGQALSAAEQTVPQERSVHSFHAYFLRPGDTERPVVYEVDRIRDGRSFTTRRVVGIQHGRAIFNMSASFQIHEPGLEHQIDAPEVKGPEGLISITELTKAYAKQLPPKLSKGLSRPSRIEARPVEPYHLVSPEALPPRRQVWFRAEHALPDDPRLHRNLLAYVSDSHFLTTSLQPHGVSWLTQGIQVASIDHAMWFHRPFRMDEWLLYDVRSPSASGARGMARGRFYDQQGRLVATTMQEGLIRDRREDKPSEST